MAEANGKDGEKPDLDVIIEKIESVSPEEVEILACAGHFANWYHHITSPQLSLTEKEAMALKLALLKKAAECYRVYQNDPEQDEALFLENLQRSCPPVYEDVRQVLKDEEWNK